MRRPEIVPWFCANRPRYFGCPFDGSDGVEVLSSFTPSIVLLPVSRATALPSRPPLPSSDWSARSSGTVGNAGALCTVREEPVAPSGVCVVVMP